MLRAAARGTRRQRQPASPAPTCVANTPRPLPSPASWRTSRPSPWVSCEAEGRLGQRRGRAAARGGGERVATAKQHNPPLSTSPRRHCHQCKLLGSALHAALCTQRPTPLRAAPAASGQLGAPTAPGPAPRGPWLPDACARSCLASADVWGCESRRQRPPAVRRRHAMHACAPPQEQSAGSFITREE